MPIRNAQGEELEKPVIKPEAFTSAPAFQFKTCPRCKRPEVECREAAATTLEQKMREALR